MRTLFRTERPGAARADGGVSNGRVAKGPASSSTLAIATATAFVLLTAALGLVLDRPPSAVGDVGAGWRLRGALGGLSMPLSNEPRS